MADQTPEEKAAADKAVADKAVADKAAADKATADAAALAAKGKAPDVTDPKPGDQTATPKVPEKYELKLPEGATLTDADVKLFEVEAKTLGLTQPQAQKLVDERVQMVRDTSARFLDELKADKDLGGANFERTKGLAEQGRDAFLLGLPEAERVEILDWFNRSGLGNHKALVRAFARLGKLVAEDKPLQAAGGDGKPKLKPGSTAETTAVLYPGTPGAGQ